MTTRESLQVVEIDIDRCSLTYGSSPCTAVLGTDGVRKCYNTFATCQDTANFTNTTETIRFARNQMGFERSDRIYPALQSVSTNPAQINLGGVSDRTSGLGKRARVRISLKDFPDSDVWFDRYQSGRVDGTAQTDEGGYNPLNRGTFFGKLRRRFPYYVGRALRVREGYVGDALASMRTRNYVITEWKGPDAAGNVTITASDVLDLADDKKSKAPAASAGRIDTDIDDSSLASFDLLPAGVGSDYSAIGSAVIGSEVVTFTRSGDTVTLTGRARNGSEAASHSEDDTFQECYVVTNASIPSVAYDLLVNYAGVDASFITLADWTDEAEKWLSGFDMNAVITKPTGVNTLISELSQFGVMFWWDDQNQKIRMRANRPLNPGETAPPITDRIDIIEGTPATTDLPGSRVSRVLFYHGQLDATDSATDGNNYARVYVAIDGNAEGPNEYDQESTLEVFSRWLGQAGDSSIAGPVASRLLNRYRDVPQQITFEYDVKNEADVVLASPVTVTSYVLQDDTGASLPTEMQVTSIEEVTPGHRFKAIAETYQFSGRYGFITENTRGNYAASSDDEKEKGTYIVDEGTMVFGDGAGPYLMF